MDRRAWQAIVHGVAKSQTWLSNWTTKNFTLRSSLKERMLPFLDMLNWRNPWGCPGLSWLYESNARERRHSWWNMQFVFSIDFQDKVKFLWWFLSVCVCFSYKRDFKLMYEGFFWENIHLDLWKRERTVHTKFSTFFFFFNYWRILLYNVIVSVVQQCESATSTPLLLSLPPTPHLVFKMAS